MRCSRSTARRLALETTAANMDSRQVSLLQNSTSLQPRPMVPSWPPATIARLAASRRPGPLPDRTRRRSALANRRLPGARVLGRRAGTLPHGLKRAPRAVEQGRLLPRPPHVARTESTEPDGAAATCGASASHLSDRDCRGERARLHDPDAGEARTRDVRRKSSSRPDRTRGTDRHPPAGCVVTPR